MIPLLVPRRADHGVRDRLWEFCRDWWAKNLPEFKVVEGDHTEGPFNRGAAINRAAANAGSWDVAVVCDADVVADSGQVTAAVERAAGTGRATFAFTRYCALSESMTARVLSGFDGSWEPGVKLKMTSHVSSLLAVPRALWEQTAGFDERFEGWGHDDVAFATACRVLGGGLERIPGSVWHLYHPPTPERTRKSPLLRASGLLARRYHAAVRPEQMRELIDERSRDGVVLVVVTDGRRDCIARTIPAAEANLTGLPITRRLICDDSADPEYAAWLRFVFPDFEVLTTGKRLGFGKAVHRAQTAAIESGQRWVFWLEDDFILDRPVDLAAMARVIEDRNLVQMALRRQAWFPDELVAGGVVEQRPDEYEDCSDGTDAWLEHRCFWTTNPHLVNRRVLVEHEWPATPHSEARFAHQVLGADRKAGYWGARTDDPWVSHFGERIGTGY